MVCVNLLSRKEFGPEIVKVRFPSDVSPSSDSLSGVLMDDIPDFWHVEPAIRNTFFSISNQNVHVIRYEGVTQPHCIEKAKH